MRALPSGQAPYLDGKPEGDQRMVAKRASSKRCRVVWPASPACKVRLGNVESKTRCGVTKSLRSTSETETSSSGRASFTLWKALYEERRVMNPRRVERTPEKHAERRGRGKRGMAYKARASWSRSRRRSPSRGKPGTWRRAAGSVERLNWEAGEMPKAETARRSP